MQGKDCVMNRFLTTVKTLFLTVILLFPIESFGFQGVFQKKDKYFVVIGAFNVHKNAQRFTKFAQQFMDAEYAINESRGLYYVFTLETGNKEEAVARVYEVREDKNFWDAWVYSTSPVSDNKNQDEISAENITGAQQVSSENQNNSFTNTEINTEDKVSNEETENEQGLYFYFNTIKAQNYKEVEGKIEVVDPVRKKEISELESHQFHRIKDPGNNTGELHFISDIFGFKKKQININFNNLEEIQNRLIRKEGDTVFINFELQRLDVGDVAIMYNVYFFKDASVIRPESKFELDQLLDMLQENDHLEIKIHGHTNGNAWGKIIHWNKDDRNFFSLNDDNKSGFGSAKALSKARAETIQQYLVDHGISEERMKVKGWGGKKMIYDKHDRQAHLNVRVEVEIVAK